jgi:hypothetical protein
MKQQKVEQVLSWSMYQWEGGGLKNEGEGKQIWLTYFAYVSESRTMKLLKLF